MQQKSISEIIENMMIEEFDKIQAQITEFEREIQATRLRRISKEFAKFGGVRD